ncbi:MAG TPA: PLP-dependent aminotransferase family protein [Methanoregulaceae archaeon]|nr:PLP-dependent aminotransferase family protein [Methanoregulaceae archaeon]
MTDRSGNFRESTVKNRMNYHFASRIEHTPRSFIREILKLTEEPGMISFAGGLPNPGLFPVEGLQNAARDVLKEDGPQVLQYATTEGYRPLREYIARFYYEKHNISLSPDNILITNGSQQCLDLVGKVLINPGDPVAIERPGYLGAIQAFSLYEPSFRGVTLAGDGPDPLALERVIRDFSPVMFYGVPNFQNPSGITYSEPARRKLAGIMEGTGTLYIEDDAYGELRFIGEPVPPVYSYMPDQVILTGSFSKIIAPGLRMGWMAAPGPVYTALVTAKQATDLHSNYLAQRIIHRFLTDNDVSRHIDTIKDAYRRQRDVMVKTIEEAFPKEVTFTRPEGGMFLWVTLPERMSAMDLFHRAIREQVAFVPGDPFYTDGAGSNSMRLNFSNSDEETIVEGITRLSQLIVSMVEER